MSEAQHSSTAAGDRYAESMMNLALLDPPKWGWPAVGPVMDLLPPHERARRKESRRAFRYSNKPKKKKRGRPVGSNNINSNNTANLKSPPPSQPLVEIAKAAADPTITVAPGALAENNATNKNEQQEGDKSQTQSSGKSDDTVALEAPPTASNFGDSKPAAEVTKGIDADPSKDAAETTTIIDKNAAKEDKPSDPSSDPATSAPPTQSITTGAEQVALKLQSETEKTGPVVALPAVPDPTDTTTTPTTTAPEVETRAEEKQPEPYNIFEPPGADPNDKVVKTGALSEKGLDIYAYHRGREGMEPRNPETGALLADCEETDTGHHVDKPKLEFPVKVKFPLVDEDDLKCGKPKEDWPWFEDTISWDLGDPETPTPMGFACSTAERFGLTFGQTVDLATMIQEQVYIHIRQHCGYREPVSMDDGGGGERELFPPYTVPHLYGAVEQNLATPGTVLAVVVPPSSVKAKGAKAKGTSSGNQGSSSRRNSLSGGNSGAARNQSRPAPVVYEDEDPIEEIYFTETKKRLVEISKANVIRKAPSMPGPFGFVELKENWVCHICHKRSKLVGVFACGHNTHSYCSTHLRDRMSLSCQKITDVVTLDHCPICSNTCTCSKCKRRLKALAFNLKKLSKEQGVDAESTVFDNIKSCYTKPIAAVRGLERRGSNASSGTDASSRVSSEKMNKNPPKSKQQRKSTENKLVKVKKIAATEFPREIHTKSNADVDPGTKDDYRTVYTEDGSYVRAPSTLPLLRKPKTKPPRDSASVVEDGNVDYCLKCRTHGNLICCDFCPRAFHRSCMDAGGRDEPSGKWECHKCLLEKAVLPEYTLTGSESREAICKAYQGLQSPEEDDLVQLSVLCKMHEMVVKLMKCDFGYIFLEPVDCNEVPTYRAFIKQPMDLGTISGRLVSGFYATAFKKSNSWYDVHLAVLRDIELVWHNCFTFNEAGSSINRMGEVARLQMLGMRKQSLDKDLHQSVKDKIDAYVRAKEKERGRNFTTKDDNRPTSRHKIQIKNHTGGLSRKIAILDPATGMLAKIYCSIRNASIAAEFIASRRHSSEFPHVTYFTLKSLVEKSTQDPTATLFGYRWLEYGTLQEGGVTFSLSSEITKPAVIEMVDGSAIYIFLSVDEALSCIRLPNGLANDIERKGKLRKDLQQLVEGGDAILDAGLKWRRLKPLGPIEPHDEEVAFSSFYAGGDENINHYERDYMPESTIIVKEDVALHRALAGFETEEAAFNDWKLACEACATVTSEEIARGTFTEYYLDGDRNVDGIVWKTADKKPSSFANSLAAAKFPKGVPAITNGEHGASLGDAGLLLIGMDAAMDNAAQINKGDQPGESEEIMPASGSQEVGNDKEPVRDADAADRNSNDQNSANASDYRSIGDEDNKSCKRQKLI